MKILLLILMLALTGCSALEGYERSASIGYQNPQTGATINYTIKKK